MTPLSPNADASEPSLEELSSSDLEEVGGTVGGTPMPPSAGTDDDSDAIATQRRERIAPSDDVFQKIR
jgi:hypothetical protein